MDYMEKMPKELLLMLLKKKIVAKALFNGRFVIG